MLKQVLDRPKCPQSRLISSNLLLFCLKDTEPPPVYHLKAQKFSYSFVPSTQRKGMVITMKKAIIIIFVVLLGINIMAAAIYHISINSLCNKIELGEKIETRVGNASTGPRFLERLFIITDMSKGIRIPLLTACRYGNVQAVETLLKNGADPNVDLYGWNALENTVYGYGTEESTYEIIKMLIDYGADVNTAKGNKEIIWVLAGKASVCGDPDELKTIEKTIVCLIDNKSVTENEDNWTILHYAAQFKDSEFMKYILDTYDFSAYINAKTQTLGYTPLICAVNKQSNEEQELIETINVLLSHGADPLIMDSSGKTAYDYSLEKNYFEASLLLKQN